MRAQLTDEVLKIIKNFSRDNKISISEFGRRAGVSKAWLSRLQNEEDANLSLETATKLLNVAGYELTLTRKSREKTSEINVPVSRLKKVVECQNE